METKKCAGCQQIKPLSEFHKNGFKNGKQRYRSQCKECENLKARKNIGPFTRKSRIDDIPLDKLQQLVKESFSWREITRKLGYSSETHGIEKTIKSRLDYYGISTEHFTSSHAPISITYTDEQVFFNGSEVADATVRNHYRKGNFSEYKCSICGLEPFWQGKELVLTLDHIDGNHRNNNLNNLRWICPNCDRQLETFSGRNHHKDDD